MHIIQQVVPAKQSDWSTRHLECAQISMTARLTHHQKYYSALQCCLHHFHGTCLRVLTRAAGHLLWITENVLCAGWEYMRPLEVSPSIRSTVSPAEQQRSHMDFMDGCFNNCNFHGSMLFEFYE